MIVTPSRNRPVPLFVYGTLRSAGTLHHYWLDGVDMQPAVVRGYELRVFSDQAVYPFMVAQPGGVVVGEVAWVTDPVMLRRVTNMEVNAGYRSTWVTVDFEKHNVGVEALAFVYPHPIGDHVIVDGDWISYADQFTLQPM